MALTALSDRTACAISRGSDPDSPGKKSKLKVLRAGSLASENDDNCSARHECTAWKRLPILSRTGVWLAQMLAASATSLCRTSSHEVSYQECNPNDRRLAHPISILHQRFCFRDHRPQFLETFLGYERIGLQYLDRLLKQLLGPFGFGLL